MNGYGPKDDDVVVVVVSVVDESMESRLSNEEVGRELVIPTMETRMSEGVRQNMMASLRFIHKVFSKCFNKNWKKIVV